MATAATAEAGIAIIKERPPPSSGVCSGSRAGLPFLPSARPDNDEKESSYTKEKEASTKKHGGTNTQKKIEQ